ncbi:MAG: hypothetical protein HFACDABA_00407 [Anaerolineales bacterium]|nr:hypothetical protein [Anaerolineales bacterium]
MTRRLILLRGGGDLASGVALRLFHAGFEVVIAELPQPLAVRRLVSFSEAVYEGQITVEDVTARHVTPERIEAALSHREIPVIVDPEADTLRDRQYDIVIDARLLKTPPQPLPLSIPLLIGLGPGFTAPNDCHAVIETQRGHYLGRVYWSGSAAPNTQTPEGDPRRVLRANTDGIFFTRATLGKHVEPDQLIAEIQPENETIKFGITSSFPGVLRGLLRDGMPVTRGLKIGDVDPRDNPDYCRLVSDKALAVAGGVIEAILLHQSRER